MSTATIGGKWTFDKNVALRGEFGRNFSLFDNVKSHRHYDASNGYFLELDYKGAAAQHVGSWGTWLQYRDGGAGFDPLNNMTTLDKTLAMPSALNGTHGWEYGFSYVPIHNVVSTLKYWNLRSDGITRNRPCAAAFHRPDCRPHAVQHASERFELTSTEKNIIQSHMWPLTLRTLPHSREAWLVCLCDKIIATEELFKR